jgi:hypothetical protein
MLNTQAKEAYQLLKKANTITIYTIELSYSRRIRIRLDAASAAKAGYIEAAKADLKI